MISTKTHHPKPTQPPKYQQNHNKITTPTPTKIPNKRPTTPTNPTNPINPINPINPTNHQ